MYSHLYPHLINLDNSSPDIEGSLLVSIDGLVMTSTLSHDAATAWKDECLGAICAGAIMLGQHASERCASGTLEQVLIRCTQHHILMTYAGEEVILAVLTSHNANLELIFLNIKQVANKIICTIDHNDINTTSYLYSTQKKLVLYSH